MSAENTVKLLWECGTTLQPKSHTHKLLKSYYINTCRKIANVVKLMPHDTCAPSQMCRNCGCFWEESEFQLKLKNQHLKRKAKNEKLVKKLEQAQEKQKQGLLTRKQKCRAKWLRKRMQNYLEIKCELCHHKTLVQIEKSQIKVKTASNSQVPNKEENVMKRKKKNKTTSGAGLTITKSIPKDASPNKQQKQLPIKPGVNNKTTTPTTNKKNNEKGKLKNKSLHQTAPVKACTKAQKQNSLVQLAALLKQKSTAGTETVHKRLKALLK